MRLALDKQAEFAKEILSNMASQVGSVLVDAILSTDQSTEAGIKTMRELVSQLKSKLSDLNTLSLIHIYGRISRSMGS